MPRRYLGKKSRRGLAATSASRQGQANHSSKLSMEPLERRDLLAAVPRIIDDFGNTFAAASAWTLAANGSGTQSGVINPKNDVDMFRIVSPFTGQLYISEVKTAGNLNPFLYVYNASGKLIASNNDISTANRDSYVGFRATAGATYYVKAANYASTTGNYTLTSSGYADDYANTLTETTPVPAGTTSFTGNINVAGDVDTTYFFASANGNLTISQKANGSGLNSYLRVYNSARKLIAQNDDQGGGVVDSQLVIPVKARTAYYVEAGGSGGSTGTYTVSWAAGGIIDDVGNTFATAASVNLSAAGAATFGGTINPAGDVDMFVFTATGTGQMTITPSAAGGSAVQSRITVYDAGGVQLSGAAVTQYVFNATAGSKYYVMVSAGGTTGAYNVAVSTIIDDVGDTVAAGTNFSLVNGYGKISGRISTAADKDVFIVNNAVPGSVRIWTYNYASDNFSPRVDAYTLSNLTTPPAGGAFQIVETPTPAVPKVVRYAFTEPAVVINPIYVVVSSNNGQVGNYTVEWETTVGTGGGGGSSTYNIELSTFTASLQVQTAIRDAAIKWQSLVNGTSDLADVLDPLLGRIVDDLYIDIQFHDLDGVGGALANTVINGQRGNVTTGIPYHSTITFDSADIAVMSQDQINGLARREIGRAMGMGMIWQARGLTNAAGTLYTGGNALTEFRTLSKRTLDTGIPIEAMTYSSGANQYYWLEADFHDEAMTNITSPGAAISRITAAALKDMGYDVVNYDNSDQLPLGLNIDFRFDSSMSDLMKQAARDAATAWQNIIKNDLPAVNVAGYGMVDDILIDVTTGTLTAAQPVNSLGYADPNVSWRAQQNGNTVGGVAATAPWHGTIVLNSTTASTLTYAQLLPIFKREIAHSLGFGSLLINVSVSPFVSNSANANAEYVAMFGAGSAPLDSLSITYGSTSRTVYYWQESTFDDEALTWDPIANPLKPGRTPGLISKVSVGMMQDMGYSVNATHSDAEAYVKP